MSRILLEMLIEDVRFVNSQMYNPAPMKVLNTCSSHVIPLAVFWPNLREKFYLILILLTSWNEKKFWFLCILPVDKEYNLFLAIAILCFKYVIWGRKLKKRILSFHSLNIEFFNTMNSILLVSGFVRECKNNAGHFICRNWDNLRF